MTTSYSGDPGAGTLDRLRWMVGDVGPAFVVTDEEIEAQYTLSGGIFTAASDLARAIAARFAPDVSATLSAAGVAESSSDRYRHFMGLADKYSTMAVRAGEGIAGANGTSGIGAPFVGGTSIAEMDAVDVDTDRPLPAFSSTDRRPWRQELWRL